MSVEPEKNKFSIARCLPKRSSVKNFVPIRVGETILWDNRFQISLVPQLRQGEEGQPGQKLPLESQEFYVRHLSSADWQYMFKGGGKVQAPCEC